MTLWVVRAGSKGEQEEGALKNNIGTIGWDSLDDLSQYNDFDSLFDYYKKTHPKEEHKGDADYDKSVRLQCGEVWTFLKKIQINDFVVLPSKKTDEIFIGKILSDYEYKYYAEDIKHTRRVEWLKTINRTIIPKEINNSFNTGLTVFEVKENNAEEFVKTIANAKEDKFEEGEKLVQEFLEKEYGEPFVNFQHKALVDEELVSKWQDEFL